MSTIEQELKMENSSQNYIGIDEVASLLSVSSATVSNWKKTGKIKKVSKRGKSLVFDKEEIDKIKQDIESGASHRLKSRRNKSAVVGNFVPKEYVSYPPYIKITERILDIAESINNEKRISLVLFELTLNFLKNKGYISEIYDANRSLTELVTAGNISFRGCQSIVQEIFDYTTYEVSESDRLQLRNLRQLDIPYVEGDDFLGLVYLSLSNLSKRKNTGIYYTPSTIVDLLIEKSLSNMGKLNVTKLIDPCCGSGNFLIKLFLRLKPVLIDNGISIEQTERKLIEKCIAGSDIDRVAVSLTKINLLLLMESKPDSKLEFNIHCQNTLLDVGTLFSTINFAEYDLVIGNPPWGYNFTSEEVNMLKNNYETSQASLESFCLFVECGLNMVRAGGVLAYVLPESLLNVKIHTSMRRILVEKTKIQDITLLGNRFSNVFSPALTVTIRKEVPSADHLIKIEVNGNNTEVTQQRFSENEAYIFNVKADNGDSQIISHLKSLSNIMCLKDNAQFALGIVTGNNKRYVSSEPLEGGEPVLKGSNVFKYNFEVGKHYIVFKPEKFQQVAPTNLYRQEEKLIYRFINENLIFAYDSKKTLSLNSANVLIPQLNGYSAKYVLAVLNSRVAQYYHSLTFSSLKVLRKHIESIPIPACSQVKQNQIIKLVNNLLDSSDPDVRMELYDTIDVILMELYELNQEQREVIINKFNEVKFL